MGILFGPRNPVDQNEAGMEMLRFTAAWLVYSIIDG